MALYLYNNCQTDDTPPIKNTWREGSSQYGMKQNNNI